MIVYTSKFQKELVEKYKSATDALSKRNYEESYSIAKDLVEFGTGDFLTTSLLALLERYYKKDYNAAIKLYKTILTTKDEFEMRIKLVELNIALGKYEKANRELRLLYDVVGNDPDKKMRIHLYELTFADLFGRYSEEEYYYNGSYIESSIINYSKPRALHHIKQHLIQKADKERHGIFNLNIDIDSLYESLEFQPDNLYKNDFLNTYYFKATNIGVDDTGKQADMLLVVTKLTGEIITMYPTNAQNRPFIEFCDYDKEDIRDKILLRK